MISSNGLLYVCIKDVFGLGLWCLMPLSTIFHGGRFYW